MKTLFIGFILLISICPSLSQAAQIWSGELESVVVDRMDEGTAETRHFLRTEKGRRFELKGIHSSSTRLVGKKVRIQANQKGGELHGTGAALEQTEASTSAHVPGSTGLQKVAVVKIYFQTSTQPTVDDATIRSVVFGSVRNFHFENSLGSVDMQGDIYGWYQLPIAKTCDIYAIQKAAIEAADASVHFSDYNRLILIGPMGGCSWSGIATLGLQSMTTADGVVRMSTAWIPTSFVTATTIAHEFGHNLGSSHSSSIVCPDSTLGSGGLSFCSAAEYGDGSDVMGSSALFHMNGATKALLNWITPTDITTGGSWVLSPLETREGIFPKVLRIKRSPDQYIYIEYRQPIGYDAPLSTPTTRGALMRLGRHNPSRTDSFSDYFLSNFLFDADPTDTARFSALDLGQDFFDPATGIRVSVTDRGSDYLSLDIDPGQPDLTKPVVAITAPVASPYPDYTPIKSSTPIQVKFSDDRGVAKVKYTLLKLAGGDGWGKPLTTQDIPWETNGAREYLFDTKAFVDGTYRIIVEAFDLVGNSAVAYVDVQIKNVPDSGGGNPGDPQVSITSPADGAQVARRRVTVIQANASDDLGVAKVQFFVDDALQCEVTAAPYQCSWKVPRMRDQTYRLKVKAVDSSGNTVSHQVTVHTN